MTPQSPKPSCHAVMTGGWTPSSADTAAGRVPGYGVATNIINGGVECGKGSNPQGQDRIGILDSLHVNPTSSIVLLTLTEGVIDDGQPPSFYLHLSEVSLAGFSRLPVQSDDLSLRDSETQDVTDTDPGFRDSFSNLASSLCRCFTSALSGMTTLTRALGDASFPQLADKSMFLNCLTWLHAGLSIQMMAVLAFPPNDDCNMQNEGVDYDLQWVSKEKRNLSFLMTVPKSIAIDECRKQNLHTNTMFIGSVTQFLLKRGAQNCYTKC
ncbi:Glycoside hydrolase, family 19, catalytic [Dillenia turbinata]|uniref:Glycoside hydrolase, family 19, catalytic n=1 Tax=Dillenia turbinata TaxID=194707 RepID=A0AAN8Z2S6_9MAGN